MGLALLNSLSFGVPPEVERPQAQRLIRLGLPFSFAFTVAVAHVRGMQRRLEKLNTALARGDELLQAFAAGFGHAFAPGGRVCRLSGGEFAVLLRGAGDGAGPAAVSTVLALARAVDAQFPDASAGVSLHDPGLSASARLVAADRAMYAHKKRTRGGAGRLPVSSTR